MKKAEDAKSEEKKEEGKNINIDEEFARKIIETFFPDAIVIQLVRMPSDSDIDASPKSKEHIKMCPLCMEKTKKRAEEGDLEAIKILEEIKEEEKEHIKECSGCMEKVKKWAEEGNLKAIEILKEIKKEEEQKTPPASKVKGKKE